MVEMLSNPQTWISLVTLTILEIVLGIDNIVFITLLTGKLPEARQPAARKAGLAAALVTRLLLLGTLSFVVKLTAPLFTVLGKAISGRDLVLLAGGLFLIYKSTTEIHERVTGDDHASGSGSGRPAATFASVVTQIMLLDIIFSLDSVVTAVGMVDQLVIMAAAVVLAVIIMLAASGMVARFVNRYPTIKMLALSFLLLVGTALVAEGLDLHIPKGYIYFAMFFSMGVEMLNIRATEKRGAQGKQA